MGEQKRQNVAEFTLRKDRSSIWDASREIAAGGKKMSFFRKMPEQQSASCGVDADSLFTYAF